MEAAKMEPVKKSIVLDMATRYGMEKDAFEATLKATVVPANVSPAQFAAFLLVAKEYNLNPITKEIYAYPAKNGGIQPIVGIDGWCNIINSNPQLDGITFEDAVDESGKIISITCRIHRKDRTHPTECTEYMEECFRPNSQPWEKWPARMLRHKALIQCARYAFGLSGIVEQDEAERQDMIDETPMVENGNGEIVKAIPSPFESLSTRKNWFANIKQSYEKAVTLKDLQIIRELNEPRIESLRISQDEKDRAGVDSLDIDYEIAKRRILAAIKEEEEFEAQQKMNEQLNGGQ